MSRRRKPSQIIEESITEEINQINQISEINEPELIVKNNKKPCEERSKRWDQVDAKRKRLVVKHIRELLPELEMQPQRILQYLRLMYTSDQLQMNAIEKAITGQVLTKKDFLPPVDDTITMMPVLYPKTAGLEETEDGKLIARQILSPMYSRFIENVRKGMDEYEAASTAGFSDNQLKSDLPVILKPNPAVIINSVNKKHLLIVWKAYWEAIRDRVEAAGISEDYILSKLKKQADFNVKELFDSEGNFKSMESLDDDVASMITEIRISETKHISTKNIETRTINIKIGDRQKAVEALSKLQSGIFEHTRQKTVNHKFSGGVLHGKVDVDNMDSETLDRIIAIGNNDSEKLLKYDELDSTQDAEYEEL